MSSSSSASSSSSSSSSDEAYASIYSWLRGEETEPFSLLQVARDAIDQFTQIQQTMPAVGDEAEPSDRRVRGSDKVKDREAAHDLLVDDYFAENSNYGDEVFRRRFRMSKRLFLQITNDLEGRYTFFTQRYDARGRKGLSPLQKCMSVIRQIAYGSTADGFDEYLKMAESTSRQSLDKFVKGIITLYRKRYLRKPTYDDIQQLYAAHDSRHGFPGMLGSIDCIHWDWSNCPIAWRGQYMRGDHDSPTIMLEAVASHDLWIWHAYFGVAGSNNDINVLQQSPLFEDLYNGKAPECPFEVNGVQYRNGYYLADGIYPEWSTFVKATCPIAPKHLKFKKAQEAARKDIERCFGVLKKRWHIIQNPARLWDLDKLRDVMYTCIILHNMILEDEGKNICPVHENVIAEEEDKFDPEEYTANRQVRNSETHHSLRGDLVEHIWRIPTNDDNN